VNQTDLLDEVMTKSGTSGGTFRRAFVLLRERQKEGRKLGKTGGTRKNRIKGRCLIRLRERREVIAKEAYECRSDLVVAEESSSRGKFSCVRAGSPGKVKKRSKMTPARKGIWGKSLLTKKRVEIERFDDHYRDR